MTVGTRPHVSPSVLSESFAPDPAEVRVARRFLRAALSRPEYGLNDSLVDSLLLAANELVTNVVLHARTVFQVTVRRTNGTTRVEIFDRDPRLPRSHAFSNQATTGRGLAIVDGLGLDWGVERSGDGKMVWLAAEAA